MLRGKNILVGVTGSIAAYKAAVLIRMLIKEGAAVQVIMTDAAAEFISPLTLSTLSKNPVLTDFFNSETGAWTSHVDLGLWADLFLIAPATANSMSKFANGICEDLLSAVYLSAVCPVLVAPAMDLDMYRHPATTINMETLRSYGNTIIDAEHGELASGLVGEGRMAEPEHILQIVQHFFGTDLPLKGKKALVTAGPTHEAIDPVRFIGNNSSGKMGYQIAEELANRGATVTLVSGPVNQQTNNPNIDIIKVVTAEEMYSAALSTFSQADIVILAAAVADYKPDEQKKQKLKKEDPSLHLKLSKTVDIAESLGKEKKEQFIVGFALETENETANALKKIKKKKFDLIVLNSLNDEGAGFGHDTNKVTIIDSNGAIKPFDLKSKKEVAVDILNEIVSRIHA